MPEGYYRHPTIHDETVVFVSEDDLWTVPTSGGIARRLTSNLGQVSSPALSPDGSRLTFTGQEEGESEVYCMPAVGGPARRLTYLGANTRVVGWHPQQETIIFASDTAQPFSGWYQLYQIHHDGGQAELLPTGPAMSVSYGPQGGMVIGRNTTDLARWKRYRGGLTGDLWIDRQGDGEWQRLVKLEGNVALPLWVGERIYFVSDHEGVGNLYSCLPTGEDLRRHTDHQDYYLRHPSTDGKRIVYHAGADLYCFDPATDQTQPIDVEFYSPGIQRNRKFVDASEYLQSYDLHPNGHSVVVTTRGKPFVMANWEKAAVQQGQLYGVHYRLATWLQDGKRLAVISDANGEEALEIHYVDASAKPDRLDDLDVGRVNTGGIGHVNEDEFSRAKGLKASPTKNQVAISNHRHELLLVDLDEHTVRTLDHSRFRRIFSFAWSPDGRWIAYSYWNTRQTSIIKLCLVETGETWEVTRPVLRDSSPAFDPDGEYLYFLSRRNFDPVDDNLRFDLSFPMGMRPYLITLRADLPSPFLPVPRAPGEKISKPDEDKSDDDENGNGDAGDSAAGETEAGETPEAASSTKAQTETNDKEKKDKEETKIIQIDLEGIADRVIAFPISEGIYGQIRGIKGKVIFSSYPITGSMGQSWRPGRTPPARGKLQAYNFETQSVDFIQGSITDFDISLDCKTLIYRSGSDLRVLKAGEKPDSNGNSPSRKTGWLDLDRIKVSVEPQAEWEQMFREAWRLQRDYFWTEDMSGVDWETVYKRYFPLVGRVSTRSEFSDLLWEMQGELGTSHAYEFGGDYRPEPTYYQGLLGADLRYEPETDSYRVEYIVQGDVWDERTSSPLAAPGLNIKPGDRLVAVNRRRVSQDVPPQALLVNQAGNEILLTFARDNEEEPRTVSVKTLYNETAARYRQWVEDNRRRVHEATNGRIGYVHIPDMGSRGFAEFHRSYLAEVEHEGLIVDVRFNGGGNVSSLILEKLARRRLGYDVSRWGEPDPYPQDSVLGPMVALTNERAGSDGDIFSHVFKLMKLGPLIGTRTWGGVIGITINDILVDGGITTQPQYSFWFEDTGWGVENYGTDPDIEVEIRPQDYVAGRDPQLERAIAEIMQRLSTEPPNLPDFSERPRLHLPTLPTNEKP